jgi:hypothetical protein
MTTDTPDTPEDLEAQFAALETEAALLKQFPPEEPPVAFDMLSDSPALDVDTQYSTEPPNIETIPLLKERYGSHRKAWVRARELCLMRGLRMHRMFETARHYVVHAFKPLKPGEGYK